MLHFPSLCGRKKSTAGSITAAHLSHKTLLLHLSPFLFLIACVDFGDTCDVSNTPKNLTWSDKISQKLSQLLQKCSKTKLATVSLKSGLHRQAFTPVQEVSPTKSKCYPQY